AMAPAASVKNSLRVRMVFSPVGLHMVTRSHHAVEGCSASDHALCVQHVKHMSRAQCSSRALDRQDRESWPPTWGYRHMLTCTRRPNHRLVEVRQGMAYSPG